MRKFPDLPAVRAILVIALLAIINPPAMSAAEQVGDHELVVLLHGLGRSSVSMWRLAARLEDAGFQVERVGYDSLHQGPDEILREVSAQIAACCARHDGPVHFVGHSLGGLVVRAYLQNNEVANLGRVVLMGTPNQGTAAVDYFSGSWWIKLLGPTAQQLGTGDNSFPKTLAKPYYPIGIIAGESDSEYNENIIPGRDDGLVAIQATKLEGMTDFIVIRTGHSMMRHDKDVAKQTIAFLKNGSFNHALQPH